MKTIILLIDGIDASNVTKEFTPAVKALCEKLCIELAASNFFFGSVETQTQKPNLKSSDSNFPAYAQN